MSKLNRLANALQAETRRWSEAELGMGAAAAFEPIGTVDDQGHLDPGAHGPYLAAFRVRMPPEPGARDCSEFVVTLTEVSRRAL